jgi:hypothetical protein
MRPSRETALRWLRQADHDLTIARGHQERVDCSDACFMAEQATQKAQSFPHCSRATRRLRGTRTSSLLRDCVEQVNMEFLVSTGATGSVAVDKPAEPDHRLPAPYPPVVRQ